MCPSGRQTSPLTLADNLASLEVAGLLLNITLFNRVVLEIICRHRRMCHTERRLQHTGLLPQRGWQLSVHLYCWLHRKWIQQLYR